MSQENSTTYTERAGKLSSAARQASFQKAAAFLKQYQAASNSIGELRVVRLNQLRAAGQQFNIGCGREQLSFGLEGIEFTRKEILPLMPDGIGVNEIHACVLIANKMPSPAKTQEEVAALEKQFQHEFEMLGLVPSRRRKELQNARAKHLFADFVSRASGLVVLFKNLDKEEPMESWPPDKLDLFLETTEPVAKQIERAKKLRLGLKS